MKSQKRNERSQIIARRSSILLLLAPLAVCLFIGSNLSDNGGMLVEEILRSIAREYGWPDYQPKEK